MRQLKVKTIKLHKARENAGEQGKIGCSLILIGICWKGRVSLLSLVRQAWCNLGLQQKWKFITNVRRFSVSRVSCTLPQFYWQIIPNPISRVPFSWTHFLHRNYNFKIFFTINNSVFSWRIFSRKEKFLDIAFLASRELVTWEAFSAVFT